jgi:tetratricopeptide (TPR) repeat protein
LLLRDAYANFLYHWRSRYAEAASEWREVIRNAPDDALAYTNLGAALNETGDSAGAITTLKRAVQLTPNYVAYSDLGLAYYREGRYAEAVDALQAALKLAPDRAMAWDYLGYVRSHMSGMEGATKEAFQHAIKLAEQDRKNNPRDPEVNAELARCYAKSGNGTMAAQRLETALALAPKAPDILAQAAEVNELLGQRAKAIELAKESVALGYPMRRIEVNPELKGLLPSLR